MVPAISTALQRPNGRLVSVQGLQALLLCTVVAVASGAPAILTAPAAGPSTRLAAAELRRYLFDARVYDGRASITAVADADSVARAIKKASAGSDVVILLATEDDAKALGAAVTVQPSTNPNGGYSIALPSQHQINIIGSDELNVLYGIYGFLENLGFTFSTAGPTMPAPGMAKMLPSGFSSTDTPVFSTRGLQPFHDFAEGPDWWSEDEHKRVAEAILSMKGNLIGFHTYPLQEPAVWVGLKENVLSSGNVTGGSYNTRWATTLEPKGAWGYQQVNTSTMGFGATQIFEHECFGHPTVSGDPMLCPEPTTPEAADELFNRVGMLWKTTFSHAKDLGIQTVLGTEIPLSIPKPPTPAPSPNPPTPPATTKLALQVYYSQSRDDYFVTTTSCTECEGVYKFLGTSGWVFAGSVANSVALCTYYNPKLNDNMLTTCTTPIPSGYGKVRIEGYAPASSTPGTEVLSQYVDKNGKHWAVDADLVANATKAGFSPSGTLASVFSSGPPVGPTPSPSSQNATEFYEGIFHRLDLLLGDSLSYYWGWTPEGWEWGHVAIDNPIIQNAVEDVRQMQQAHDAVKPSFALASCGWTVGPAGARWYYDTVLPSSWTISSIDMDVGNTPVDPAYANITHRSAANKWAIPWAEDDPGLTAPELWVNRSLMHARDANKYGVGGLLSIHWRTRATSPQIGSAHAVAWNINLTPTEYWSTWAKGQFGDPSVATKVASIFESIDSFETPRPVNWIGGPGGLRPGCATGAALAKYDVANTMSALRPAMLAAIQSGSATLDHLERFDYWCGSLVYMKSLESFQCQWEQYNAVLAGVNKITDPAARKAAAIAQGIPARVALMANFTVLMHDLLSTVSTIEGSGTIYNILSHGSWDAVGPVPTAALETLTGAPLPAAALRPNGWSETRAPIARVQVVRTMLAQGEPLRIRAIVLTPVSAPPTAVTLFSAAHGSNSSSSWVATPLVQAPPQAGIARFVYTVTLPAQPDDFNWYVKVDLPPPTAPYTNGLGIPAGTKVTPTGVTCLVPPGGASSPQSVVVMPK